MKKNTVLAILTLIASIFTTNSIAQGYTYTLINNGNYNFSIGVVPDNNPTNNFATSVQSYGFTIILPDGVTITTDSSLGGGAGATFFDGTNVGDSTIDGYLVTETLGAPISLPAPSAATTSVVYTFTVNGSPTSGQMYILRNNSALANAVTPLKAFMQADMEDDGSAMYSDRIDNNGQATSGVDSFDFNTLSTTTKQLENVGISPNPTNGIVTISFVGKDKNSTFEVFDVQGRKVFADNNTSTSAQVNTSINLNALATGVYLLQITNGNETLVKRIVKN